MATKTLEDHIDLIDRFLLSDQTPDNSIGLSDLDAFLTGIVVGPELIMPSDWLSVVSGGKRHQRNSLKAACQHLPTRQCS
jgi:uncharacterized protein